MKLALVSLALVAFLASAAHAQSSSVVVEGRVVAVQENVPRCGDTAVASWALVDVVQRIAGAATVPARIRVMVQCQALEVGRVYRLTLASNRPVRGDWEIFSVIGEPPSDVPLYWLIEQREHAR